jgi:hypothetical protein
MAKVAIKSEKLSPFGGIFSIMGNYFISTKALVPNYEESLINEFLLMGISIKAA